MVQQMTHFKHEEVLRITKEDKKVTLNDIKEIYTFYNVDCKNICKEINNFSHVYSIFHINFVMTDIASVHDIQKQMVKNGNLDEKKKMKKHQQ